MRRWLLWSWAICMFGWGCGLQAGTLFGKMRWASGEGLEDGLFEVIDIETFEKVGIGVIFSNGAYRCSEFPDGTYYLKLIVRYPSSHLFRPSGFFLGQNPSKTMDPSKAKIISVRGRTHLDIQLPEAPSLLGKVKTPPSLNELGWALMIRSKARNFYHPMPVSSDGLFSLLDVETRPYEFVYATGPKTENEPLIFSEFVDRNAPFHRIDPDNRGDLAPINLTHAPISMACLDLTLPRSEGTFKELQIWRKDGFRASRSFKSTHAGIYVPEGKYQLRIFFKDRYLDIEDPTVFHLKAGQKYALSYPLERGARIKGRGNYPFEASFRLLTVKVYSVETGRIVKSFSSNPFSGPAEVAYDVGGLRPGKYKVQASWGSDLLNPYYPGTGSYEAAQVIELKENETISNIHFEASRGGVISGRLFQNGELLQNRQIVYAWDLATKKSYFGLNSNGSYEIKGLPQGSYLLGVNPSFRDGEASEPIPDFMTHQIGSWPDESMFHQRSYFPGTPDLKAARVIRLGENEHVSSVQIQVGTGGVIAGRFHAGECPEIYGDYLIGAFRGENLEAIRSISNGAFYLQGLEPGIYQLRISKLFLVGASVQDKFWNGPKEMPSLKESFAEGNYWEYPQSLHVGKSKTVWLDDWCLPEAVEFRPGEAPIPIAEKESRLVFPWISYREGDFESALILNNRSQTAKTVHLQARRSNGKTALAQRTIPALGFLKEPAKHLFPELGSGNGMTVEVTTGGVGLYGSWLTQNPRSASGGAPALAPALDLSSPTKPFSPSIGKKLLLDGLAVHDELDSAGVFVNLANETQDITVKVVDVQGEMIGERVLRNLAPLKPFALLLKTLMPQGASAAGVWAQGSKGDISATSFVFNNQGEVGMTHGLRSDLVQRPTKRLVFPWVSQRTDAYESFISIHNGGNELVDLTLTAKRFDADAPLHRAERTLLPGNSLVETGAQLFPDLIDGPGVTVSTNSDTPSYFQGGLVTVGRNSASHFSPAMGRAAWKEPVSPNARAK